MVLVEIKKKLFMTTIFQMGRDVKVPGRPFQPSLIFMGMAWSLLDYNNEVLHSGRLPVLPTHIRLGWGNAYQGQTLWL